MDFSLATISPSVARTIPTNLAGTIAAGVIAALQDGGWGLSGGDIARGYSVWTVLPTTDGVDVVPLRRAIPSPICRAVHKLTDLGWYGGWTTPLEYREQTFTYLCPYDPFKEYPGADKLNGIPVVWFELGRTALQTGVNMAGALSGLGHFVFEFSRVTGTTQVLGDRVVGPAYILRYSAILPGLEWNNYFFGYGLSVAGVVSHGGGGILRSQQLGSDPTAFIDLGVFVGSTGTVHLIAYPGGIAGPALSESLLLQSWGLYGTWVSKLNPRTENETVDLTKGAGVISVVACPHQFFLRTDMSLTVDPLDSPWPPPQNPARGSYWNDTRSLIVSMPWQPVGAGDTKPRFLFVGGGNKFTLAWPECRVAAMARGSMYYNGADIYNSLPGVLAPRHIGRSNVARSIVCDNGEPLVTNAIVSMADGQNRPTLILGKLWNCAVSCSADTISAGGGLGASAFREDPEHKWVLVSRQRPDMFNPWAPTCSLWCRVEV